MNPRHHVILMKGYSAKSWNRIMMPEMISTASGYLSAFKCLFTFHFIFIYRANLLKQQKKLW